jgi:transposase
MRCSGFHIGRSPANANTESQPIHRTQQLPGSALRLHVQHVDALDAAIAEIDREADAGRACFRDAVKQLSTIPGVSELSAQVILSEIGIDMGRFATAAHLRSWAGLCPRNDESAGKRRSTRLRRGAPWLKAMLVKCAWAAARTKPTYLHAQFVRLRARRGPKKAICAVAASILTAAFTCSKTARFMKISEPCTSIVGGPRRKRAASSNASPNSVFPSNSSPRRLSHEQSVSL